MKNLFLVMVVLVAILYTVDVHINSKLTSYQDCLIEGSGIYACEKIVYGNDIFDVIREVVKSSFSRYF